MEIQHSYPFVASRLRLFSLIPLALSVLSARSLYHRRKALLRTVAVVEISTGVVLEYPPILGLSLCLLLVGLIASLPFLSLILRLTLIGYYAPSHGHQGWHVRGYAGWLAALATGIWLWSWGVIRGALRVAVTGVVGSWYFSRCVHLVSETRLCDVLLTYFMNHKAGTPIQTRTSCCNSSSLRTCARRIPGIHSCRDIGIDLHSSGDLCSAEPSKSIDATTTIFPRRLPPAGAHNRTYWHF